MRITTLIFFLFSFAFQETLFGQTANEHKSYFIYAEMLTYYSKKDKGYNVALDTGQVESSRFKDNLLVNVQSGEALVFNSRIDALNYLSRQGWELQEVYVTNYTDINGGSSFDRHWILRKKL